MFNNSVSPLPALATKKIPVRPTAARPPRMPAPVRSGNPFPTTTRKLKRTSGNLVPTKKIRSLIVFHGCQVVKHARTITFKVNVEVKRRLEKIYDYLKNLLSDRVVYKKS